MGRHAQGWKILWRNGIAYVRFRHQRKRFDRSTGARTPAEAATRAADIYARCLRGAHIPRRRIVTSSLSLEDLFVEWLVSRQGSVCKGTIDTDETYTRHLLAHFNDVDAITTSTVRAYSKARLAKVLRKTVRKELSALRTFLAWAAEEGHIGEAPYVPTPAKTALGTRQIKRKAKPVELSSQQVERLIAALPVWSRFIDGKRIPVRAFIRVLWETGLRPSTVHRIEVPRHWKPGSHVLEIEAKNDKARYERELPLTPEAVKGLTTAYDKGKRGSRPFGRVGAIRTDYRKTLRRVAKKCRLPDAEHLTLYDFRHGRASDVLDKTSDLLGAAYMLGHKQLTTTNRYLHPEKRAGQRVVRAISKGKTSKPTDSGGKRVKR